MTLNNNAIISPVKILFAGKISPLFVRKFINQIIDETIEQVSNWRKLATENEVPDVPNKKVETEFAAKY